MITVSFTAKKPTAFTSIIELIDTDGTRFPLPVTATTDNSVWLPDHILAYALFLVRVRHRKTSLPRILAGKSVLKLPSVCWLIGTAARSW